MDKIVVINGIEYDYKYCGAWIKYNRLKNDLSQEALAYKICSVSHLSYFENGKKKLHPDMVEALLKKLNFKALNQDMGVGSLRQMFSGLASSIEMFDYVRATELFNEIQKLADMLETTIYNIEYKIYKTAYMILVERKTYVELEDNIKILDKIYMSLPDELKYFYSLATGKLIFDFKSHSEGIARLHKAHSIFDKSWINYRLGVAYCHDNKHFQALTYLRKALADYESTGKYFNALNCHNFLSVCMISLSDFDQAESHLTALMDGSEYFSFNKSIFSIYTNYAELYYAMSKYEDAMNMSMQAMASGEKSYDHTRWQQAAWHLADEPVKAACIYVKACIKLLAMDKVQSKNINTGENGKSKYSEARQVLDKYTSAPFSDSRYYYFLLFLKYKYFEKDCINLVDFTRNEVLPYYKRIGFLNVYKWISIELAAHYEKHRQYKAANTLYKEMLVL